MTTTTTTETAGSPEAGPAAARTTAEWWSAAERQSAADAFYEFGTTLRILANRRKEVERLEVKAKTLFERVKGLAPEEGVYVRTGWDVNEPLVLLSPEGWELVEPVTARDLVWPVDGGGPAAGDG